MSKRITRKHRNGSHFLAKPSYQGSIEIPTSIELIQYSTDDVLVTTLQPDSQLKKEINRDKINWFKVTGISDVSRIAQICHEFGLHAFDVKELMSKQQLVKVVQYNDITFILMSGFYADDDMRTLNNMQIAFIAGENVVVSFKEAPVHVFDDVLQALKDNNALLRQKGPDYLLYILLSTVNSLNTSLIIKAEDLLAEIEDQLILQKESENLLQFLHAQRLDYMHIKRFMVSFREEYYNLQHSGNNFIQDENVVFFEDLDDRLRTTLGRLDDLHESIISLLDLYYNNNNLKLNLIMKRLTVVSTIFIPLTFMVGVWGMNFKVMPELEWEYGYLVSWVSFVLIGVIVFTFMKIKKWF